MRVRIDYLGQLRRHAGLGTESLEVPEGLTVVALLRELSGTKEQAFGRAVLDGEGRPQKSILVFVNDDQVADSQQPLHEGDVVTLLTPMAGG